MAPATKTSGGRPASEGGPRAPQHGSPVLRVLRGAALAVIGAELAYVALANGALASGLIEKAVTRDELETGLRCEGAWTIVPGLVHFRHAAFQSQDSKVQWVAQIDHGRVWVALWPLARKKISLSHLRGKDLVFRFRHRVETDASRQPKVAAYPSIFGLEDPPVVSHEAALESDPSRYWNVSLHDVDATVREIWLQEYRYVGPGRVYGSFQLAPKRRVWVGPAELELLGGGLSVGEHRVARGVEGVIRADIPEFDVQVPQGLEVLRHVSARIDLDAQIEDLSFLDTYGPPGGVAPRDGSGQLAVHLNVERGVALEGSRVRYETRHLALQRGKATVVVGAASADWRAGDEGASFALDVPFASLYSAGGRGPIGWARGVGLSLALPKPDFSADATWRPQISSARVGEAGVDDLSRLHDLTGQPEGWALRGGSARASGELRAVNGGEASAELRAKAENVELRAADARWTGGQLSLSASTGPFAPQARAGVPGAARVEGRDIAFTHDRGASRNGWWFALDLKNATLGLAPAPGVRSSWALRARDLSPLTAIVAADGGVPDWFAKWLDLQGVNAAGGVAFGSGRLDLEVGSARAGALDGQGRYLIAPDGARGAFRLAMGPLAAGLRLREGQKVDVDWPLGSTWLADEVRALNVGR